MAAFPFALREVALMGRTARIPIFGAPSRHDREVAEEMLGALGIRHLAARPYTEVSGGERQLTLIARALAQEPEILVMDEPTASLDFGNQVRVLEEVQRLARRGIAVVMSTHDPDQAFLCADQVAILHEGRLVRLGSPREVITREALRQVYGVEVEVIRIDRAGRPIHVCVPSLGRPDS
jgi:iron complex transport system ATP-binding protein